EDQCVASGVAGAPDADAVGVHTVQLAQICDHATPVEDLARGVDVVARPPSAEAEAAVVMHDHQETGSGETLRIRNESLMFDGSEPVRHADCGSGCAAVLIGAINPCVQIDPALRGYPVLFWLLGHDRLLSACPATRRSRRREPATVPPARTSWCRGFGSRSPACRCRFWRVRNARQHAVSRYRLLHAA